MKQDEETIELVRRIQALSLQNPNDEKVEDAAYKWRDDVIAFLSGEGRLVEVRRVQSAQLIFSQGEGDSYSASRWNNGGLNKIIKILGAPS